MKRLKESILGEKKYDYHCTIPPYYMQMIIMSLESYKNAKRSENYTDKEIEDCIKLLNRAEVE